jgi:arsenite methyltransferase
MPEGLKEDAELYAGCVSGAIPMEDYLGIIKKAGFEDIQIQKLKPVALPESMLEKYLNEEERAAFNKDGLGIFSLTVFARRAE